jgi:flagellar hook-associated protein 3 FlgL
MRITMQMFYDRFLSDMQRNMEAIFRSHEQLSTGKRINRPSDDPTAMSRAIGYKTEISAIEQHKRAVNTARNSIESIESALTNLNNIITRARELAMSGATGSVDAGARRMIASEVDALLQSAIGIANTRVGDRYIFSGFRSDTPPIGTTGASTIDAATDTNSVKIDIHAGITVEINMPAIRVFNDTTALATALPPTMPPPATPPTGADRFVLQALNTLRLALEGDNVDIIRRSLDSLDSVQGIVLQEIGEIGATLSKINAIEKYHNDRNHNLNTYLSNDTDTDIARAVSEMAQRQTALEGLRTVSTEFMRTSLFDFLR